MFALLLLLVPVARAGDSDFHAKLRYDVDPALRGCWDEADFKKKVIHRVGYESFRDDAAAIVSVRVEGATGAIGGNVDWQNASGSKMGERHFVAKDGNCGKLLAEMAFAVALQIQMLGLAPKEPDTPTTEEVGPSTAAPSAAAPEPEPRLSAERTVNPETPQEQPAEAAPRGSAMWLGLGPQAAVGMAPSPLLVGRLFFGLRRGGFSFEVGGETSYPETFHRWGGSGFRELLLAGSLALCHHQGFAAACLLGKAGELRLVGESLDVQLSPAAFVAHAGVRLGANVELSKSWFVAIHVDGLVLITPCTVEISGSRIWEMPRLAGFAGFAIAARFR